MEALTGVKLTYVIGSFSGSVTLPESSAISCPLVGFSPKGPNVPDVTIGARLSITVIVIGIVVDSVPSVAVTDKL